ncbi:glutathione S-transferase [Scenedesmus sp. NREL 46B-D3]|nr:glutathione S-transferase [Scenedesmus sp. NREL 46B-D3]
MQCVTAASARCKLATAAAARPQRSFHRRSTTGVTMAAAQEVLAAGSAEPAAGPDRQHPLFITTWSCPYAQRTWIALNAKGIKYNTVFVDLMNKPEWFFQHNEYGRVPTLVWKEGSDTNSLYESLVCNEFINDLPGPSLLPEDATQRGRARLVIDQFGAKFGSAFGRVIFSASAEDAAPAAKDLSAALTWLEGQASSSGPFIMGAELTLVDAALAPFYVRLQVLEKLGLYSMPDGLPKLSAWGEAVMAHPAVAGSVCPPDPSQPYMEQLLAHTKEYIAKRRAAMSK